MKKILLVLIGLFLYAGVTYSQPVFGAGGRLSMSVRQADSVLYYNTDVKLISTILVGPVGSTDFTLIRTKPVMTTIDSVFVLTKGTGAQVVFDIEFGTNRTSGASIFSGNQTASNTTVGQLLTTFADNTIPIGNMIWLQIVSIVNTPEELICVIYYH